MAIYRAGQTIRFTYNQDPSLIDEATGDRFKEVLVLNPSWQGKMHGVDMKRLTAAEREVLVAIFDKKTKKGQHRIPLVNDVLRRMNPLVEVKNPVSFYQKFVKVFLRNKDAYRTYEQGRILNPTIVKETSVLGGPQNPTPLFHKVESKAPPDQKRLDLIRKVAGEKGVGVSSKVGGGVFKKV